MNRFRVMKGRVLRILRSYFSSVQKSSTISFNRPMAHQTHVWPVLFTLFLVSSFVHPVHAEQATSPGSPLSGRQAPAEQDIQQRLEKVEKELERVKAEQEREKLELERLAEERKKSEARWETKFDLLRRDPQSRLESRKEGWLGFEGFETQVRFGGFLQVNLIHNFQDTDNTFGKFQPARFPVPSGKTTSTEFDPRSTRLALETRTPTPMGNWSTFVSIDFFGNNSPGTIEPRLRQAYITGVGVFTGTSSLIGQAISTFRDLQVFPEMFDLQGPNAWGRLFNTMLRMSWKLDQPNHWIATIAFEDPESDISNGNNQTELPDGIARIDYNGDQVHFSGGFVGRQLKGTDTTGSGTDRTFGYGLNFAGKIGIPEIPDTFKFYGFYGSGIGRYINDLDLAGGQDAYYDNNDRELKTLEAFGGFGGYTHWWTDKLRSTGVLGYVRVDNRSVQPGTAFKESFYTLANLIFSPFNHYDIGMEYYWGQRKNKNGQTGHANRLMVTAKWHY